ncbi:hypothetical protein EYF80_007153 [Liparis tanakae]|uniref:Uncharacterized protein n=1 Tax=Liparis tanakae TaxID=230148 RepID=A0A4Z2IXD8_9TELE|nr:hypothetical protein EYF80_007153 [Liparis tanakae]
MPYWSQMKALQAETELKTNSMSQRRQSFSYNRPKEAAVIHMWPTTPMEQAVDTSSEPNHTDAILDGIPRMNTCAKEQQNCPRKVTANKLGWTLTTLIHVPVQLSAVATNAMTRSPFLSSSQVTGKMKGMYVNM